MISKGIAYIVDQKYEEMLYVSLLSLLDKGNIKGTIPIIVYSFGFSEEYEDKIKDLNYVDILDINKITEVSYTNIDPHHRQRIIKTLVFDDLSPFDITLLLDADTIILNDINGIFHNLEKSGCSFAAVPEIKPSHEDSLFFFIKKYKRKDFEVVSRKVSEILGLTFPDDINIPYFNGGVLCAYKGDWSREWREIILRSQLAPEVEIRDDQLPLQAALINTETKVLTLNPTWNFSFFTSLESNGHWWNIMDLFDSKAPMQSTSGDIEPLRILHAIGGKLWTIPFIRFPANKLYLDYMMSIIYKKEN